MVISTKNNSVICEGVVILDCKYVSVLLLFCRWKAAWYTDIILFKTEEENKSETGMTASVLK